MGLAGQGRTQFDVSTKGAKRFYKNVKQLVIDSRREHSRNQILLNKCKSCGDLPRIELFARQKVQGWDCYNEV